MKPLDACPYCGNQPAVIEHPMHFTVRCTNTDCPTKPETARSRSAAGARAFWAAHLHRHKTDLQKQK